MHTARNSGLLALVLASVALPCALSAQATTLDQGAFRLLIKGQEVGRETFDIRQNGTGAGTIVVAEGHVTLQNQELTSSLELTGPGLRPAAYQMQVKGRGGERIAGQVVGNRFSARILSPAGEQMREYLAGNGAVVVDDGVAHQYYFLARRADDRDVTVPLLVPRENRQVMAQVQPQGRVPLDIDGHTLQARKLVVRIKGETPRTLWVDSQDRVLKLEIPARDYEAIRTEPPR